MTEGTGAGGVTAGPRERALAVERMLRAAARSGNRLLAGAAARVELSDPAVASELTRALLRSGMRRADADGPRDPVDFVFVDSAGLAGEREQMTALGFPVATVALDGSVRPARGADAAERIAWARRGLRTTSRMVARLRESLAIAGERPRLAVSLVLEPKTAAFALALADAGFHVAVFAPVEETDAEVASALAADGRVRVFARTAGSGGGPEADVANAAAVLEWGPEFLIDDGAHLIRLAHTEHPRALAGLRGAAEETTSGVRPLRELASEGRLRIPVIAVNDARTKTDFDNLIGTGQSCVFAIADLLEEALGAEYGGVSGTDWTVLGYGPVGAGTARFAAALGARVSIVERDPVRALAALHDGHSVRSRADALAGADVVVSATGVWHTLAAPALAALAPGTVVAVAGGIDEELALGELRAAGWRRHPTHRWIAEWLAPGEERGPLVLADGAGVNYTAGEGNPIEIMDLSFATQAAALRRLVEEPLPAAVHALGESAERAVAAAALGARGATFDAGPAERRPGGAAQHWTVHRYRDPERR